ncbi:unnamed protein product [Closterium sp. NIES-65]|nr:unnamed protein product [Closterium sp. NIES-65]
MATPSVLAFDDEGRAIDFDVWVDDLQLFLQCDRADGLSLFDLTSGASPAPAADADATVRSKWATRDAAARLAVRRHLPTTERANFSQYKSAKTLYDAVVARYSSPATAALCRLILPYLFHDLAAFPMVADLITHLRTSDIRYRAPLPAEFCAKNPPAMGPPPLPSCLLLPMLLRPTLLVLSRSVRRLPLAGDAALARASGARALEELAGVVEAAVKAVEGVGVAVGVVAGVGALVAAVEAEAAGGGSGGGGGGSGGGGSGGKVELVGVALHRGSAPVVRGGGTGPCTYVLRTGDRAGEPCGGAHSTQRCFGRLTDAWHHQFPEATEIPRWGELSRAGVPFFVLDCDAILAAMYAVTISDEGDCYRCFPPGPGIGIAALGTGEAAALGAGEAGALGASESASSGAGESALSGTACSLSGRPLWRSYLAHFSTVQPCPAAPSGTLSGLYLPSFSTNLVSGADLQDAGVHQFTPASQRVTHCTCARTGRHLATFTRRPGSSLYTLTTESPPVLASGQVAASGQVFSAASRSGPESSPCSCRLLSHQTLLWHHRLGHPSLPRLRGIASRVLVSGLPRYLPPLPPGPAPTCVPCVKGRHRAAPHSSQFPPTEGTLQTLHMDVWGPARVRGQGHERYFLLVVDDYSRYTTVFPLRSKGDVTEMLIDWIRADRLELRKSFSSDFPVLRLHSDRGGEFSSGLLQAYCCGRGIRQTFTLPDSPQKNGIAERRIGMVMDVAHTSMMHAAAPHFLWPFAVRYAAHQISLQPTVSMPETSPALLWTGKVGDASAFRVWGSRAFIRDLSADKLSPRAAPCVFLGFPPDALGWQFYHPTSRRVPTPVDPLPPQGPAPSGVLRLGVLSLGVLRLGVLSLGVLTLGVLSLGVLRLGVLSLGVLRLEVLSLGMRSLRVLGLLVWRLAVLGLEVLRVLRLGGSPSLHRRRAAGAGGSPAAEGAGTTGPGCARTGSTGATGPSGAAGAGASVSSRGPTGAGAAEGVGTEGTAGVIGGGPTGCAAGAAGGPGASGAAGGAGAGGAAGAGATIGGTGAVPAVPGVATRPQPYFVPLLQQSESQLQLASPLPAPSPYTGPTGGLAERREPAFRPASPVRAARASGRGSRQRPPPVPGTHRMSLRPSTAPLRAPLPSPPSSLPALADQESDSLRAASPTVMRLLATVVTDPSVESAAASALVSELVDFAARCCLDYAASLVAESESVCPPSVGGECARGTDVLEDRQEEFQCLAAASPHLVSVLLTPEGDPDALDIPNLCSYAEAIEGPYSSQWQAAMDAEMASWKSTGTYVDEVPPPWANIVSGMWIFRVKRPPGSPPVFKACYVARGFSQRQGVDYFQTFSPTPKMTTLRVLLHIAAHCDYELHSLDFCTAFLQGSLHEEIWLRRPLGFTGTFPTGTQWSLQRPVYGLCQAPREPEHMVAAKRMLRYLCSTSGMGLVLGGRSRVVLTGHADASWADDQATQRSSQGYTFSLGSGSVAWRSTSSSSVLGSSCEAEIYAGAMAAQELRWLTYLLTDLGEPPRSPPVLYVDNKAMLALCREQRLEHRTKHIALRYFLARELQQRGQLRLAYVASQANTADILPRLLTS